ncbi:MAG: hypothetical protein CVV02_03315 [Firmicutes bacterium HGW-Firmicutes-7]|nr:MAG: hypothetical protein CVV02_03315 [Firmicutes bacterium HGW-Firmicutes-7]
MLKTEKLAPRLETSNKIPIINVFFIKLTIQRQRGYTMCLIVQQDAERRDLHAWTRVGAKKTHSIASLSTT